jgi:hypothetical protein
VPGLLTVGAQYERPPQSTADCWRTSRYESRRWILSDFDRKRGVHRFESRLSLGQEFSGDPDQHATEFLALNKLGAPVR